MLGQVTADQGDHSINTPVGERKIENMVAHEPCRTHKKKLHVTDLFATPHPRTLSGVVTGAHTLRGRRSYLTVIRPSHEPAIQPSRPTKPEVPLLRMQERRLISGYLAWLEPAAALVPEHPTFLTAKLLICPSIAFLVEVKQALATMI